MQNNNSMTSPACYHAAGALEQIPANDAYLPHPTCPQMRHIHRLALVPHVLQRLVLVLLLYMQ
jgi:hypothetical protein